MNAKQIMESHWSVLMRPNSKSSSVLQTEIKLMQRWVKEQIWSDSVRKEKHVFNQIYVIYGRRSNLNLKMKYRVVLRRLTNSAQGKILYLKQDSGGLNLRRQKVWRRWICKIIFSVYLLFDANPTRCLYSYAYKLYFMLPSCRARAAKQNKYHIKCNSI